MLLAAGRGAAGLFRFVPGTGRACYAPWSVSLRAPFGYATARLSVIAGSSVGGVASPGLGRSSQAVPGGNVPGDRPVRGSRIAVGSRLQSNLGMVWDRPAPSCVPGQLLGLANPMRASPYAAGRSLPLKILATFNLKYNFVTLHLPQPPPGPRSGGGSAYRDDKSGDPTPYKIGVPDGSGPSSRPRCQSATLTRLEVWRSSRHGRTTHL